MLNWLLAEVQELEAAVDSWKTRYDEVCIQSRHFYTRMCKAENKLLEISHLATRE